VLLIAHPAFLKISSKFTDEFLSYPANRQTDRGRSITSLAEVVIADVFPWTSGKGCGISDVE